MTLPAKPRRAPAPLKSGRPIRPRRSRYRMMFLAEDGLKVLLRLLKWLFLKEEIIIQKKVTVENADTRTVFNWEALACLLVAIFIAIGLFGEAP